MEKIDYGFKDHLPPQPRKAVPEDSIFPSNFCKYLPFCPTTISDKLNMLYNKKIPEGIKYTHRPAGLTSPRSVRLEGGLVNLRALPNIPISASDIYNIGKKCE